MLSPMLALRGMVVFEGAIRSISVGRPASILAVKLHLDHGIPLALFPQLDPEESAPSKSFIFQRSFYQLFAT